MSSQSSSATSLFGLDLAKWPSQWREAGEFLLGLPLLRGLNPGVYVRLIQPGAAPSDWLLRHGHALRVAALPKAVSPVEAFALSRDSVLERRLRLPRLAAADLQHAVELEVAGISPFPADDTVFGFVALPAADGADQVDVVIASRAQVTAAMRQDGALAPDQAEVWVTPDASQTATGDFAPLILRGFGESRREALVARGRRRSLGWVLLAVLLLAGILLTPTLFARQRAIQAQAAFDDLQRRAAPQMAQRQAAVERADVLRNVGEIVREQLALAPLLNMLTTAVPDGAWLTSLRLEGRKLVLNGNADDAAALVQRLASQPGVSDVRLASPATRAPGDSKERFIIELTADPARYGVALGASAQPAERRP